MKNYYKLMIESFVDSYEKRRGFDRDITGMRVIQIEPEKLFKEYVDRYNHEAYREINAAIQKLIQEEIAESEMDAAGKYKKVKLQIKNVDSIYQKLGRVQIPILCENLRKVIEPYLKDTSGIMHHFCNDQMKLLKEFKKLPYDIGYDKKRLEVVLNTLRAVLVLQQETYVRNFSTAIFKDSKEFQKNLRSIIQSILYDYSEVIIEKNRILEIYNLFDNPTYVMIKGQAVIKYDKSVIHLEEMNGGIAIPNAALNDVKSIDIQTDRVITVENLTTYHDTEDEKGVIIYLGGFHNEPKQKLLKLIYQKNKDKLYFHKGDLDVFGFLILENLKEKTEIPFIPFEMDVETLRKFYDNGLYKPLSAMDRKAMKSEKLQSYKDVFNFMLEHDCKVEQESMKALELVKFINKCDR